MPANQVRHNHPHSPARIFAHAERTLRADEARLHKNLHAARTHVGNAVNHVTPKPPSHHPHPGNAGDK